MLTAKQNMLEVIRGGNPDRIVNQYEAVYLMFHPFMFASPLLHPEPFRYIPLIRS